MKKLFLLLFIFNYSFSIIEAQHYNLYGLASKGGINGDGVLFRFDPFNGKDSVLFNFDGTNGSSPGCNLILNQNNTIFGTCGYGGSQNDGILFNYNIITENENTIINFTGPNGNIPGGGGVGVVFSNGIFYGTTAFGGIFNAGVIFRYNPISNNDSTVFNFNDTDGATANGGLFVLNDTTFYGMTRSGGLYDYGVIYKFNPITNKEIVLFNFNGNISGGIPQGTFIKDSNGLLYAVTGQLGMYGDGTLISFNPLTNSESTLVNFNGINGKYSFGDLFLATDSLLFGMAEVGGNLNDGVLFSYNVNTNHYNTVLSFDSINGKYPDGGSVVEDTLNKILYGVTYNGGKYNEGVIFSYNIITGKDSVVLNFDGTNGANPFGTLLIVYDTTTGINDIEQKRREVGIYPNPNDGQFILSLSNIKDECSIEIYNVFAENIFTMFLPQNQCRNTINLSGQPNGLYLYRVINENGGLVGSGKVVIEK
jgi:uncharacterized repeat protein (TIGR03803 family)